MRLQGAIPIRTAREVLVSRSVPPAMPGHHLFSLLPPGCPSVPQYRVPTAVRPRPLVEPDKVRYTIRLPA
jgi:hypothetical protein